ncbi:MAG: nucleotidyltransferase family protein [Candidatus Niyogibacteria bacterium]|nr:nucleotidyltransferase family protein [Candidatus Niyogibacteria bacterium]
MKAVILAAGEGLRMRPLTLDKPKPLLEVAGKPLLVHIWESLPSAIDEVIVVVGYKSDAIRAYFGNEYLGKKITYIVQSEKTGTARALQLCREALGEERFLLLYADDLHHRESIEKCLAYERALLVAHRDDPRKFGVVVTDDRNRIVDIEEKPEHPKSHRVAAGVYVLDSHIFDYEPARSPSGEYFLTDMIGQMLREHDVIAIKTEFWHPIGYPEDLKTAEELLKQREL